MAKRRQAMELKMGKTMAAVKRRRSTSVSTITDEEHRVQKKMKTLNVLYDVEVVNSFSSASSVSSSGVSTMKSSDGLSTSSADDIELDVDVVEDDAKTKLEKTLELILKAVPSDLSRQLKLLPKGGLCRICTLEEDADGRGPLRKCEGTCGGLFHYRCAAELDVQMDRLQVIPVSHGKKKKKKKAATGLVANGLSPFRRIHVTGDMPTTVVNSPEVAVGKFKCKSCQTGEMPNCFICHRSQEEVPESEITMCTKHQCGLAFHLNCLDLWPQSKKRPEGFVCPQHQCHTCISDDPRANNYFNKQKLLKCCFCPTTYHLDANCIPAGTELLSHSHIICQKHNASLSEQQPDQNLQSSSNSLNESKAKAKAKNLHLSLNVNWCFICTRGGNLLCCDLCPSAFHMECLKLSTAKSAIIQAMETYVCEECEAGRFPLFGELVWAKFSHFRWWPAVILTESMIPDSLLKKSRNRGDFCCKFLGSNDHAWLSRRRVFLYHEDDALLPFEDAEDVSGGGGGAKPGYVSTYHRYCKRRLRAY